MFNPTRDEHSSTICVAVLGTCDTKLDELLYVRKCLLETHSVRVKLVDVGRTPSTHPAVDIPQSAILAIQPTSSGSTECACENPDLSQLSRNDVITALSSRAARLLVDLVSAHAIHGLISLGGSGGSALAAGVFDALPLGFPKLLVSTMAAGDVGPYVRDGDVAVMYSVVDIVGLNDILSPVLENAAGAIAGMARAYCAHTEQRSQAQGPQGPRKTKRIAITMFGVTTPAVTHARAVLSKYACTPYVFHATGAGGRAMERLIGEGFFNGVLDLTTTELADELVDGTLSAGAHRLEAAAKAGIPQVVSLGALDMVNFGPMDTVPERWKAGGRRLYEHNPSVTLMRTNEDECAQLGRIVAEKLQAGAAKDDSSESGSNSMGSSSEGSKTEVWIPRGGVSTLSVSGGPFEDRKADDALFRGLKEGLQGNGGSLPVVEKNEDINDPAFVEGMVASLAGMMQLQL
ncbi:UPF0261 domain protein [Daedaleopsis nitida]|nr:UPF0261 domain protein [Daedaleopsis nitida]